MVLVWVPKIVLLERSERGLELESGVMGYEVEMAKAKTGGM